MTMNMELYAVLGAIALALMILSGALLGGTRLVRLLSLPQDLPEGPRFSSPPPPLVERPDPVAAKVIRLHQDQCQARYARARAAWEDAGQAHEIALQFPAAKHAAERAEAAAKAAEAAAQANNDSTLDAACAASNAALIDARRHRPT